MPDPSSSGNKVRLLQRGELLFSEGEKSRSMYLIKKGAIRLFMKKGNSNVEVDTVREGQILGELAFLDGNPRSLSGEALGPCELIEISGDTFLETLAKAPEWLKILLKTVVGRLRTTNSRLRQLEAANQGIEYSAKPGSGSRRVFYQYLSWHEFMKVCSAIQLESLRAGKSSDEGHEVYVQNINIYAHTIFGVPTSKVDCVIEILETMKLAKTFTENKVLKAKFQNLQFLDDMVRYLIEENRLEPSKRHQVSERAYAIMKMIEPELSLHQIDPATGRVTINLIDANQRAMTSEPGSKGFKIDELGELVQVDLITALKANSASEVLTTADPKHFKDQLRYLSVVFAMNALNVQKSRVA